MGLTVKEGKKPNTYWVGLDDHTKVFIPADCDDRNESEYRQFLVIEADTPESAINQVTMMLLENKYNTITDTLWAWR